MINSSKRNIDRTSEALSYIPSHDRETWIQVGMALKQEYGDDGFLLFSQWSCTANSYNPEDTTSVWRSFKSKGVGIGSIFRLASQNGFNIRKQASTSNSHRNKVRHLLIIPKLVTTTQTAGKTQFAKALFLKSDKNDRVVASHPYSQRKGINGARGAGRGIATGSRIGRNADCIIVPIRGIESNKLQGVQCINDTGIKQNFGCVSDGALLLGNTLKKDSPWFIAEGWASAVSTVFDHGKNAAVVAFGKGNLDRAANQIAQVYAPEKIIVLREVDR